MCVLKYGVRGSGSVTGAQAWKEPQEVGGRQEPVLQAVPRDEHWGETFRLHTQELNADLNKQLQWVDVREQKMAVGVRRGRGSRSGTFSPGEFSSAGVDSQGLETAFKEEQV